MLCCIIVWMKSHSPLPSRHAYTSSSQMLQMRYAWVSRPYRWCRSMALRFRLSKWIVQALVEPFSLLAIWKQMSKMRRRKWRRKSPSDARSSGGDAFVDVDRA